MESANDNEFVAFPKIPRLKRGVLVTEKIDGTNAQVAVAEDGTVRAGSRTRWITPDADNFGFARWVKEHEDELRALGPGRHFGEWWGVGIQRSYGLHERRFSLFNVSRWGEVETRPACCNVVPVLYSGEFTTDAIDRALAELAEGGSVAAPGFTKPEGIIVYHTAANRMFKRTLDKDDEYKGKEAA